MTRRLWRLNASAAAFRFPTSSLFRLQLGRYVAWAAPFRMSAASGGPSGRTKLKRRRGSVLFRLFVAFFYRLSLPKGILTHGAAGCGGLGRGLKRRLWRWFRLSSRVKGRP